MEAEIKRLASRALGGRLPRPTRLDTQNLTYPFDAQLALLAVRYARTPSRVIWDLVRIQAHRLEPLYDHLIEYLCQNPPIWLRKNLCFSVEVPRSDSFAAGPLQIRGTVKNAIIEASQALNMPAKLQPEQPDVLFRVEADDEGATIGIDIGGRSLHRRGERTMVGEASLKETLASQILVLARWDPRKEALVDPMTGAGTLVLEAAGAARGRTTWKVPEVPAASKIAPFDTISSQTPDLFPGSLPPMACVEVHTPAFRALSHNLERAQLHEHVSAMHADFRDVPPDRLMEALGPPAPKAGLIVVNPPYGERLERGRGRDPELEALYGDLFQWWQDFGLGWRIAILGPGPSLKAIFGPRPKLDKPMRNGPLSVSLLVYEHES